ncbi:putative gustatory receptor 28b [Microplitis mediator]|uniref:putative gustatory receptor 28b n=1 Tax=Microplitis mediator TaxID=375433 RepID=UPI00255377DF|nr:putative gustatory receptor 28b [Microplitis mediator]
MNKIMGRIKFDKLKDKFNFKGYNSVCHHYLIFMSYFSFKIIGLLPWKMETGIFNKIQKVENKNFKSNVSYVGSCYNILLVLVIVSLNIYIIYDILPVQVDFHLTLRIAQIKLSFVLLLCASIIPLIYIFRQKLLINVLNRFENLDKKLNKCADYKAENNYTNYLIFTINFVVSVCIIIMREIYYMSLKKVFIISFSYFIGSFVIIQYTMLLNMIKTRFTNINSTLLRLGTSESKISLSRASVLDDIGRIKRAYVELCEMSENISNFYGFVMLIVIIVFVVRNLFNLYYAILVLIHIEIVDIKIHICAVFFLWSSFLFTVLATHVTKTVKQNKKTARIINLLMDRYAADEKIKDKLAKFSSNLWHLTVEFTVCDLIPLDRTLLAMIAGTLATYLVIAVQFRISSFPNSLNSL